MVLLVVGLGALGSHILELLATKPELGKIVAADYNERRGLDVTMRVLRGSAIQGFYTPIEFKRINLYDVDGTAELLKDVAPDFIINATAITTWWLAHLLPVEISHKILSAGLGPWVPGHLTLTYNLMKALKKSGIDAKVTNCSYADVVNPILSKIGLAPTVGGGNIELLTPRIQWYVATKLGIPMREVRVMLVCHHSVFTSLGEAPFYYKILVRDRDMTDQFKREEIVKNCVPSFYKPSERLTQLRARALQYDIASSFVKNTLGILWGTGEISHSPGPKGLPGGYPVRLNAEGPEVVLPEDLTLEEAVKINEEMAKYDGVEEIKEDGTLVVTDKAYEIMKETLGYDCKQFKPDESAARAKELMECYRATLKKYNITY